MTGVAYLSTALEKFIAEKGAFASEKQKMLVISRLPGLTTFL